MSGVLRQHSVSPIVVTTGLVPVVHGISEYRMDCRDKPGNDDGGDGSVLPTWFDKLTMRFGGLTMRSLETKETSHD